MTSSTQLNRFLLKFFSTDNIDIPLHPEYSNISFKTRFEIKGTFICKLKFYK